MKSRSTGLRRRPARIEPRRRVLIVCEGEKTEPGYLRSLRITEKIQLADIEVVEAAGVPRTIVERAVRMKRDADRLARRGDSTLKYDEVWCVFDVDAHPGLTEALQQSRDNGIQVALSNPCFELWILLHFQEQTAWLDRRSAQSSCRKHLPKFRKEITYAELKERYDDALQRAQRLEERQRRNGQPDANPVTWVHLLTERLLELSRGSLLRELTRR